MLSTRVLVVTLGLCLSSPALAKKYEGVTMPDTYTEAGKKLVLNGMGVREATVFNVNVYVAGLYLEKKATKGNEAINSEQVKRLHLVFVRDVDRDDITDAWHGGFKKNAKKEYENLKPKIQKLNGWMKEFKEKDTLTFTYVPKKGLSVSVNGKLKGTINDTYFSRVMFAVFLGKPPNSGLKKGLLTG